MANTKRRLEKFTSCSCKLKTNNTPTEKFLIEENGNSWNEVKEGTEVFDKTIELSCDYSIVSEFRFDGTDYNEEKFVAATSSLSFGKIMPAEFKFFTVIK